MKAQTKYLKTYLLNNLQKSKDILHYFYYDFAQKVYSNIKQTETIIENNRNELYKHSTGYRIDRNAGLLKIVVKVFKALYPDYITDDIYGNIENSINRIIKNQQIHMKCIEALEYGEDWALIIYDAVDSHNIP